MRLNATSAAIISVVVALATGPVTALAQPGTLAAGQNRNTSNEAGAFFFDSATGSGISIDAFDVVNLSMPLGDGPGTTTESARVILNSFGGVSGSGCYDLPPSDFKFASGSAALHAAISAGTTNCGGPAGTFPTPFTLDATWIGNAPVTGGRSLNLFDCGAYSLEDTITNQVQGASATGNISPVFSTSFSAPQDQLLRTDVEVIHAQGVQPDGCEPAPGIPGGAGPPPAGDYQSNLVLAGAGFFDPTTGSFAFFGVTESTQLSNPKSGPSATTTQFQVHFNITGNGQFAFGCFQLSPANFSNVGASSATLSLSIDQNTPTCFGGPSSLPLLQTLSVSWAGIAPVATQRTNGDLTCLTYRIQSTGLTTTSRAAATASLSPMFSGTFSTPDQGSLETSTGSQHAEGVQQPVCHL